MELIVCGALSIYLPTYLECEIMKQSEGRGGGEEKKEGKESMRILDARGGRE